MAFTITLVPTYSITLALTSPSGDVTVSSDGDSLTLELQAALRGPSGVSGGNGIEFPFAWGDASPRTVEVAAAAKLVYGVELHVDEPFDGAGAQLQVGDAGDAGRLMAAGQNDPAAAGTYTTAPAHRYGADTTILLTITPGVGATAGTGLLTLFIEQ